MDTVDLKIDRDSDRPIFLQIVDELEGRLEAGRIPDGTRLPATRDLARHLHVNRNTVVSVYQELVNRGRATAHTGRGTFLRATPPADTGSIAWDETLALAADERKLGDALDLQLVADRGAAFSFATNFPPGDLLPVDDFRRVLDQVIRRDGARLLTYGSPAGYLPLREWLAREMSGQGTPADADQVIITTGSQQGIDLAARALLNPGERVLMEEPGFPLAIGAFRAHGAEVAGIDVDGEGMRSDRLATALEGGATKLIYLVPEFQNPTGACLSQRRREEILGLASRHRVPILEDDAGGPLRFSGETPPSLRALDRNGLVLYLSTFSKKLLPGLRVGWMCVPEPIRDCLVALKQLSDCATSLVSQAALYEFCRQGLLEEHLQRVRPIYRERHDAMVDAMRRHFPEGVSWTEPEGGLMLWVTLPPDLDAREVLVEARARGIEFTPGDLFYVDSPRRNRLRLTFGGTPPERIRDGIRMLGDILARFLDRSAGERRRARDEALPLV